MKWIEKRPLHPEKDLETRWDDLLQGKLGENEEAILRDEISISGRKEEFESQAVISAHVKEYLHREEPPHRLFTHYEQLAREEHKIKNRYARHTLWRGIAGTLAASLALFIVLGGAITWLNQPDAYEVIAKTSRLLWNKTMLEGLQPSLKGGSIERMMAQFERKRDIRPKISLKEDDGISMIRAQILDVTDKKVANVLLRTGQNLILLSIYRVADQPMWAQTKEGEWIIDADEYPRNVLWRHGRFIFSLTGYARINTFKELTKRIDPKILESH